MTSASAAVLPPHDATRRRPDVRVFWAALGAVVLGELWWAWPAISGDVAFYTRDILPFRLPYAVAFAREVNQGHLPLWSSSLGGGMPLLTHPSAELTDPFTWLFVFLPPHQAFGLSSFFHLALSTLGAALLCRSLKVHPVLCAWAGALYAGSGPVASMWTVGFMDVTALPWVALGGRLCASNHRAARWVTPLAVAYKLLRPDPPVLAAALLLAASLAITCAVKGQRVVALKRLALGCVVGALLAAPFLLPATAVVASSARLGAVQGAHASVSWMQVLDSLAPGASGLTGASGVDMGIGRIRTDDPFVRNMFLGMTWLALLCCGAVWTRRFRGPEWALLGVAVLLAVLSRGQDVPLMGPLWRLLSSRFPEKLLIISGLALLVLGARVASTGMRKARLRPSLWPVVALAVLAGGVMLAVPQLAGFIMDTLGAPLPPDDVENASQLVASAIMRSAGLLMVATLSAVLAARGATLLLWMILAAGCLEASVNATSLNVTTPVARLWTSPFPMQPIGNQRLYAGLPHQPFAILGALAGPDVTADETVRVLHALGLPLMGVIDGASYVVNADISWLEPRAMHALTHDGLVHFGPMEAVRLVVKLGVERLIIQAMDAPLELVEVTNHQDLGLMKDWLDLRARVPRPVVSVETRWLPVDDFKESLIALARKDGADVVVESAAGAPPAPDVSDATVVVEEHHSTRMRATTQASTASLLVVREVMDPAFSVEVDGSPARMLTVNTCQRGVWLPPGKHTVDMRYSTPRATAGWLLGLLGVVLLVSQARLLRWMRRAPATG